MRGLDDARHKRFTENWRDFARSIASLVRKDFFQTVVHCYTQGMGMRAERLSVAALMSLVCVVSSGALYAKSTEFMTHIDIPSEPLADAIQAVARQTHINILVDPHLVEGRRARALNEEVSIRQ